MCSSSLWPARYLNIRALRPRSQGQVCRSRKWLPAVPPNICSFRQCHKRSSSPQLPGVIRSAFSSTEVVGEAACPVCLRLWQSALCTTGLDSIDDIVGDIRVVDGEIALSILDYEVFILDGSQHMASLRQVGASSFAEMECGEPFGTCSWKAHCRCAWVYRQAASRGILWSSLKTLHEKLASRSVAAPAHLLCCVYLQ